MDIERIRHNWECFVKHGIVNEDVNPLVAESWKECRLNGVDPMGGKGTPIDDELYASILRENQPLIEAARPMMQAVYNLVRQSHSWLVLTDSLGYIIHTVGDDDMIRLGEEHVFFLGILCDVNTIGTTAISLALEHDTEVKVIGAEHYCQLHHNTTAVAAPIHGFGGEIIGCLDIIGKVESLHHYAPGLAMAMAFGIETYLKHQHNLRLMQLALDGNQDSMIVLDNRFHPVWTNIAAQSFLELSGEDIEAIADFRSMLPDVEWEELEKERNSAPYFTNETRLVVKNKTLFCSATITPITKLGYTRTYSITLKRQEQMILSVNLASGNRATYTFDHIYTQNHKMQKTIALAKKYSRYTGIVLIQGESGTGKELFAQSIHNHSDRAEKPFVAINCASLPRELVESELFGYEKGAFTGAHREGNPGKFELADGGSIFLDEIGELPLEFQAKLLRVVETRMVRRIGGKSEKKLNVRIIAATNRNLQEEVRKGRFRDDLFFRINVFCLTIPSLRERTEDIIYIAEKFLDNFNKRNPEQKKKADELFMAGLATHQWPGNVRELQNSIERAFYASSEDILGAGDLEAALGTQSTHKADKHVNEYEEKILKKIVGALEKCNGNVDEAARKIHLSRASIYRYTKKYGITPKDYK